MMVAPVKSVAIIGGGFTGAAIAYFLATRRVPVAITVYEVRPELGLGLAYGTSDLAHRINVPAAKMTLVPGQDSHFTDWIAETNAIADDPEAKAADGQLYVRRAVFGRYVSEHVQSWIDENVVRHVQKRVKNVHRTAAGKWIVEVEGETSAIADIVIIATTHPPPSLPDETFAHLKDDPRIVFDATAKKALSQIGQDARVIIVGSGLTMADVVASLDRQNFRGQVLALSRRGLQSRGHALNPAPAYGEFVNVPPLDAIALLRKIRQTIRDASERGIPWQSVIDAVREQASLFWPAMPVAERRRIVRYLRPYWDVHRFRIAPQPEDIIENLKAADRFRLIAGRIVNVSANHSALDVSVRRRGSKIIESHQADALILTTGPDHASITDSQDFLRKLALAGWIQSDPLLLGLLTNRSGHAIGRGGVAEPSLLIAGPLARFEFGELMGLPQVTNYAHAISGEVASQLSVERFVARPPLPATDAAE